jgi:hypothetical protein
VGGTLSVGPGGGDGGTVAADKRVGTAVVGDWQPAASKIRITLNRQIVEDIERLYDRAIGVANCSYTAGQIYNK